MFFRNVEWNKKLGRIGLGSLKWMIFYQSECIFEIFLTRFHTKVFVSSLSHELASNVVNLPTLLNLLLTSEPLFLILKCKELVNPISLRKFGNFFVKAFHVVSEFVSKYDFSVIFKCKMKLYWLFFDLFYLNFLYFAQRNF